MINKETKNNIVIAVPKGRILKELTALLVKWNIEIEKDFFTEESRKLIFSTNQQYIKIIKCRSFDVATFVSHGVADIGIAGSDVIEEFSYSNIYNICDLEIGKCRLSIAGKNKSLEFNDISTTLKIASKYPNLTKKYFDNKAIQTEIIKLNGAIEIAANLGLCDYIVDLVSTGNSLKANNLFEIDKITNVSSRIIANKASLIVHNEMINQFLTNMTCQK